METSGVPFGFANVGHSLEIDFGQRMIYYSEQLSA